MYKREQILLVSAVSAISISVVLVFLKFLNRKPKQLEHFRITYIDPEDLSESEIIEDGDSVYIKPPTRGSLDDQTEDDKENERLTKYIEENFPTRFETTKYSCLNCNILISPHGKYYRCSDCDDYVLCSKCYDQSGDEIHEKNLPSSALYHTNEFIYSNICFPGEMKKRLFHTFSCSEVLKKSMDFYKDRKFFGEKHNSNLYPSSFRNGYGVTVGSFTWYSVHEVQLFVEYLACAIDSLGGKKFDIVGVCSENRLEWGIVDFLCISKVRNVFLSFFT